jgi:Zn-dependent membrane protease YugP
MHFILLAAILLLAAWLPSWWVRHVMERYRNPDDRYPGTGAELIHHLAERLGMDYLKVETGVSGQDHYDPTAATIRLGPENHDGRSLTAITVAAHEMGHAIQHADGMPLFHWRQRLVRMAHPIQRFGVGLILAGPLLAVLLRSPRILLACVVAGLAGMAVTTLVHLVTLPVETDASFRRALPLLERGGYLDPADREPARRILRAAALTYVAQSLASLINLGLWIRILRP